MPPFGERKPKPSAEPVPSIEVIAARKTMFNTWIGECADIQSNGVEALLAQMESTRDG